MKKETSPNTPATENKDENIVSSPARKKGKKAKGHTESETGEGESQLVKALNYLVKAPPTKKHYAELKSEKGDDDGGKVILNISNLEINNIHNNNNNSLLVSARDGKLYNETKNDSMNLDFDSSKDAGQFIGNEKSLFDKIYEAIVQKKKILLIGLGIIVLIITVLKIIN
jgi:hypothetical protein